MAVRVAGVVGRAGHISANKAASSLATCGLGTIAAVSGGLLRREVSAGEVRDRAVAFGLLRLPASGERPTLNAQAISRLFLAAYQLPAFAASGDMHSLRQHWQAQRHVFVPLPRATANEHRSEGSVLEAFRVLALGPDAVGETDVLLSEMRLPLVTVRQLPLERFLDGWAAAGNLLFVGVSDWSHLPSAGSVFFGGQRGPDGVLHWNSAECDTDTAGRILRF